MMKRLAAGGFKDITRIASSSPEMWEQICMTNRQNLAEMLRRYIASLSETLAHNREHGEGALRISFYDKDSMEAAWAQLAKYHYELIKNS